MKPKHYLLISIALIFSAVSLGISILFFIDGADLSFKMADFYIRILIAVAAAITGLSILALYSVFNANIDKLREEIQNKVGQFEIDKVTRGYETEIQKKLENLHSNTLYLFVLTSEHTPDYYKMSAIQHFINLLEKDKTSINFNMKETILQYYGSLTEEEKNQPFFPELEKLIGYCKNKGWVGGE